MLVTLGATFLALAVVFVIIGYRVFESGGSAAPLTLVSAALPADAKVLSTAIGEGRLAVTVATGGATEIWMFDLKTLKATGRIRLAP